MEAIANEVVGIEWKGIPGLDGYEVSRCGKVRSIERRVKCNASTRFIRERILKANLNKSGYYYVCIYHKARKVHRLVALTYLPNPEGYPVVNHIDGNKLNNALENLEWCTHIHNCQHASKIGLTPKGEKASNSKLNEHCVMAIRKLLDMGWKLREVSELFGIAIETVNSIKQKRNWKHLI